MIADDCPRDNRNLHTDHHSVVRACGRPLGLLAVHQPGAVFEKGADHHHTCVQTDSFPANVYMPTQTASHVHPDKLKLIEEFEEGKDHVFLPKHPNMTGETDKCWACGLKADPEKCIFKETVNWRRPIGERKDDPDKQCAYTGF